MAASSLPRGLILDLVTPFTQNGDIDEPGLGRILRRAIPHCHGLLLASPFVGEGTRLDARQRWTLLESAIHEVRGEAPILIWISQATPDATLQTLHLLREGLESAEYPGRVFWVDAPLYHQSNRGLPRYYQSMVKEGDQDWVLYNDPNLIRPLEQPFKRTNLRTSILKELGTIEKIQGLIFSGTLERSHHYQKAVRARADFKIYDGDESRFLTRPSLSGVVSAGANLAPREWRRVTDSSLHVSVDREEIPDRLRQIWEAGRYLAGLMRVYKETPVPLIKRILFETGILESPFTTFPAAAQQEKVSRLREIMIAHGERA